jgi:hypothetical protein
LHIRAFNNVWNSIETLQARICENSTSIPVQIHKFHCKKGDQKTTRKARDPSSVQLFFFFLTYAMDKVAEPFPAFASTTSVPPSCVLLVRALMSS